MKNHEQWEAGKLITQAREARGISQHKAAKLSGISDSWWRRIEAGGVFLNGEWQEKRPTRERLIQAATAVGAPVSQVLEAAGMETRDDIALIREKCIRTLRGLSDSDVLAADEFLTSLQNRSVTQ